MALICTSTVLCVCVCCFICPVPGQVKVKMLLSCWRQANFRMVDTPKILSNFNWCIIQWKKELVYMQINKKKLEYLYECTVGPCILRKIRVRKSSYGHFIKWAKSILSTAFSIPNGMTVYWKLPQGVLNVALLYQMACFWSENHQGTYFIY